MNSLDKRMLNFILSAETKKYVKYSIHMQMMMACSIIVLMAFHYGNIYFSDTNIFPEVPKPQIWQFIWLTSLIPGR
jgi:amino acid permease